MFYSVKWTSAEEGGVEGLWGGRIGWDGVVPTKTWLRFVVTERKNVLAV